jgi:hypothetical protein
VKGSTLEEDPFDRLLDAMPKMAEAVNAFGSPEVQRRAFDALLATLAATVNDESHPSGPSHQHSAPNGQAAHVPEATEPEVDDSAGAQNAGPVAGRQGANGRARRSRAAKKNWPVNRDINWMPPGKVSLKDFVAEKAPATNHEKCLIIGYYLKEYLERATFDVSDVLGAYKAMSWKVPADPANTLQAAASVTSWFDTRDTGKVRVTHIGDNAVEHELPRPSKK